MKFKIHQNDKNNCGCFIFFRIEFVDTGVWKSINKKDDEIA